MRIEEMRGGRPDEPAPGSIEEAHEQYESDKTSARRVIDHPEDYFRTPTEEDLDNYFGGDKNIHYRNGLYLAEIEGIPVPPLMPQTGKTMFLLDLQYFLNDIKTWNMAAKAYGLGDEDPVFTALIKERRIAIERLAALTPEEAEELRKKADSEGC